MAVHKLVALDLVVGGSPKAKRKRGHSLSALFHEAKKAGAASITTPGGFTVRFGAPAANSDQLMSPEDLRKLL